MFGRLLTKYLVVQGGGRFMSMSSSSPSSNSNPLIVCFGRPGAGKTTVANAALERLERALALPSQSNRVNCIGLDLDACVPQWMRDNFAKGIYPTLEQRNEFAQNACDYVEGQIADNQEDESSAMVVTIVSFSFVNADLRDIFRSRFPNAEWVLINTTVKESSRRIQFREGHFYKGNTAGDSQEEIDEDNSEWDFAPVTFQHHILDGNDTIESNGNHISDLVLQQLQLEILSQ